MPVWCFDLANLETKYKEMKEIANNTFNGYLPNGINETISAGTLTKLAIVGALLSRSDDTRYRIPNQMKALNKVVLGYRMDCMEGVQAMTAERVGRSSKALQNALCHSIPSSPCEPTVIRVFPAWPKT